MSVWTEAAPTEPGWYWWRDGKKSEIFWVTKFSKTIEAYVDGEFYKTERLGGEWWPGPIPLPVEDTK